MELSDIAVLLDDLPGFPTLRTVDELDAGLARIAGDHPGLCRRRRVGTSRAGDPLHLLSIGSGSRQALIVGGPHPNEPIGMLTVLALAELVAETPALREGLDFTWNFIGCLDPDGTRLNERWFGGPYTVRNYHEHFYRPAFTDQPEWTFPVLDERAFFDRTLPETEALARVIDELRPRFQYSLHNSDFGGVFFLLSQDIPGVADDFSALAARQGVPLSLGPVDALGWPESGPAVYLIPPVEDVIRADTGGGVPRHGGSSAHYAQRHGTTTLITEVPFWQDARAADPRDSGQPYRDVLLTTAKQLTADADTLDDIRTAMEPKLRVPSPLRVAAEDFLRSARTIATGHERMAALFDRNANHGEVFGLASAVHMMRLRTAGVLRRQLAVERDAGNQPPELRAARRRLDDLFRGWCEAAERELATETFSLRALVALQIGAALAAVARLA